MARPGEDIGHRRNGGDGEISKPNIQSREISRAGEMEAQDVGEVEWNPAPGASDSRDGVPLGLPSDYHQRWAAIRLYRTRSRRGTTRTCM